MANVLLIKAGIAASLISPYRIVKFDAADATYVQTAAAADLSVGVCESVGPAKGEPVDVIKAGIADVEYGGTVTRGQPLTSDAQGRAVAAAPAAGSNVRIIGFAEVSGVSGDIGAVLISPCVMQG